MIQLVLGGARSGKSRYAEQCAQHNGKTVIYIATAQAWDEEMQARIQHHKDSRPEHWQTLEEPLDLVGVIGRFDGAQYCILIDCLTLWVTNLLCAEQPVAPARADFLAALEASTADIILVSNETGMGVVPMGELSRQFCDESGWLHQAVAALADRVTLMVAGIPMPVKQPN